MPLKSKCDCGNNKFLVITEKIYEGYINEKGILACAPEEQHIDLIRCSICNKNYAIQNFREIDY